MKLRRGIFFRLGYLCLIGTVLLPGAAFAASCESLRTITLAQATIEQADVVAAGTAFPPSAMTPSIPGPQIRSAFCRIQGIIHPAPTSLIRFEVWLPEKGWNGNFNQVGNGGLAGAIWFDRLSDALERGYAVAATDDGTGPVGSHEWLRDPERVKDYGYRAVHETTIRAKRLVEAYYGKPARKSFFTGRSKGGQEGLMEAQRFPEDFDAIAVWAPGAEFTHIMAHMIWGQQALTATPSSALPIDKLELLHRTVLAMCAGKDGGLKTDNFLTNPAACHFDPSQLLCKSADAAGCLNSAQIEAARKIYGGARNPRTSVQIAAGMLPGSEAPVVTSVHGWGGLADDLGKRLGQPVFANAVFGDPNWDWHTFDFDKDMARVDVKLAPVTNATSADLRAFAARGGKLLITHGWDDPLSPSRWSIEYLERVKAETGIDSSNPFIRLFMIPGQGHTQTGSGPNMGPSAVDQIEIIAAWAETGRAPEQIIATRYVNDDQAQGVSATRVLCAYPRVSAYIGHGDETRADSFTCEYPKHREKAQ